MILAVIGREILCESTKRVINVMTDINDHNDYYVNVILEELDIYACVNVIHSMMDIVEERKNNKTIKLCLKDLHDIINKIEVELSIIKKEIPIHKKKWFYYVRTPNYYGNVDNVVKYKKILDKRLELFMNVLRMRCNI